LCSGEVFDFQPSCLLIFLEWRDRTAQIGDQRRTSFFFKTIILLDRLTALDKDGTNIVLTQLNGIGLGKIANDWTK